MIQRYELRVGQRWRSGATGNVWEIVGTRNLREPHTTLYGVRRVHYWKDGQKVVTDSDEVYWWIGGAFYGLELEEDGR